MLNGSGQTIGICTTVTDITEQRRARDRLMLLNEASTAIGSTLDVLTTAQELADVLCPRLSDWTNIDLLESMLHGEEPGPFTGHVALSRAAYKSFREGAPETVSRLGDVVLYPAHSPRCNAWPQIGRSCSPRLIKSHVHGSPTTPCAPADFVSTSGTPSW